MEVATIAVSEPGVTVGDPGNPEGPTPEMRAEELKDWTLLVPLDGKFVAWDPV